jgi:hypothetical protein
MKQIETEEKEASHVVALTQEMEYYEIQSPKRKSESGFSEAEEESMEKRSIVRQSSCVGQAPDFLPVTRANENRKNYSNYGTDLGCDLRQFLSSLKMYVHMYIKSLLDIVQDIHMYTYVLLYCT